MAQFRSRVAYGLSDALLPVAPFPITARRAPTSADIAYLLGTIWIYKTTGAIYILSSVVANVATWQLVETSGGAGVFTTLTSTSTTTLATTVASANTFGNIIGNTSVDILVGTGGFGVNGVSNAIFDIGSLLVTGTISIGGTAQTGAINIGSSSAANTVNIGAGAGATTVNIGTGVTNAKTINIGTGAAMANTINIGGTGASTIGIGATQAGGSIEIGDLMVAGTINIGGAAQTGAIFIGLSTAAQTISIGNGGTSGKTILIGTASAPNAVTIGSTNTTAATVVQGGTGGIYLNAPFTELPGPVYIYTGVGDPGAPLALHAGDLYIRLDPAGATTRMFIATGVGTWTNFTCAA